MTRTASLASCLGAGALLVRGAMAQVTTANIFLPIAGGSESLMSAFQASVVTTTGDTTVFAMSCTDGPCNPIAGGTGTLTFTAAPDTFMYHETFADGPTMDWQCTIKGCPSVTEVKCVDSVWAGTSTSVWIYYPTESARMPLLLDHEVPEPTPTTCPTPTAPVRAGPGTDSTNGPEETGSGAGSQNGGNDAQGGKDGGDGGAAGSSAFANAPMMGLAAGAVVAAVAMVL